MSKTNSPNQADNNKITNPATKSARTPDGYERENPSRGPRQDESSSQWEGFKDVLRKLAQVPKEEVDEMRVEREREKKRVE